MSHNSENHRPRKWFTPASLSWGLYDLANTIFSMNVVSLYFALWIVEDLQGHDLMVALARSSAMLLIALTMPFLGAVSDRMGNRKLFILIFTAACCMSTALLGLRSGLWYYLVFFGIAVFSFQAGLVFYNALLPDVSPPGLEPKVSGLGVAMGYIGSIAGMLVVRPFVGAGETFSRQAAFIPSAIMFAILSIPLFIFVRERKIPAKTAMPSLAGLYVRPYRVFTGSEFPLIRRFLIARFFIVEGMETIISFMAVYLVMVAFFDQKAIVFGGMDQVMFFLVIATLFAVIGSFVWGLIADRIGPGSALKWCSFLWVVTMFIALVNPVGALFWIIGPLAGIGLGGVWTTDRAFLLKMIPESRRAEFFGLYALSGRLAAVIGPVLWGLAVKLGNPLGSIKYRIAVAAVFAMMLIGYLLIRTIPSKEADARNHYRLHSYPQ